jgi:8-oxo-dGTP diphosphatase
MFVLLRHAHAGDKHQWTGPDELRPLSESGRRQASALPARFRRLDIKAIISSPTLRCVQTVAPLAAVCALPVTRDPRLEPGHDVCAVLALLDSPGTLNSVVCTHGEVLLPILAAWQAQARMRLPSDLDTAKAGAWVIWRYPGPDAVARYLAPPA